MIDLNVHANTSEVLFTKAKEQIAQLEHNVNNLKKDIHNFKDLKEDQI